MEILELLQEKIENTIREERAIIISITDESFFSYLNKIYVVDYEINENQIYLQEDNFELNINLENIDCIIHEELTEECFMIIHNNNIISLYL